MRISAKTEIEFEFCELLSKISEFQTLIKVFENSVTYNSLTEKEQEQVFALLGTLVKDLYCEADKLENSYSKLV